jgi:hypothetical protein
MFPARILHGAVYGLSGIYQERNIIRDRQMIIIAAVLITELTNFVTSIVVASNKILT